MSPKRIVVGISGASGTPLALHTLRALRELPYIETHLVMTDGARLTAGYESNLELEEIEALSDVVYREDQLDAAVASGTFVTAGMIIIPCSMKTVAGIANGYSDNLLLRAADVTIKEQRPLVLVARETPLSPIHLKNMTYLSTLPGVSIVPPVMSYYIKPESIEDMEHHIVAKALARFGIEITHAHHWGE